jgi:hypothetical protein
VLQEGAQLCLSPPAGGKNNFILGSQFTEAAFAAAFNAVVTQIDFFQIMCN